MDFQTPTQRFNPRLVVMIGAVVAVILAVSLIFGLTRKTVSVPNENDAFTNSGFSREAIVTVTDQGFEPSALTIAPHTRVTWKTDDGATHNLVINDTTQKDGAPTDSSNDPLLPNDADITADASVSHVFEKRDTYSFHDQANETANLTITVK